MPTRRTNRSLARAAMAFACAALALPSPALAAESTATSGCTLPATWQAFAGFGDLSDYYPAPGGDFEALTWKTEGKPAIVSGNEPFFLTGASHASSLRLKKEAGVTSAKFCIAEDLPHLRFMARSLTGDGQLDVRVDTYDEKGKITDSSSGGISPDKHLTWAPTRQVSLNTSGMEPGETAYATLNIYSQGDWLVDNVLIDPYRR